MRILLLNWRDLAHPEAGGAERYVHEIARRWAAAGHQVTQFAARPGSLAASDERDGVEIVRAGSRLSVYREAARFIARSSDRFDAIVESINTRPFFAHRHARGIPTLPIFHQLARDVWPHEVPAPVAIAGRYVLEPRWLRAYRGRRAVAVSASTAEDLRAVGITDIRIAHPGTPARATPLSPKAPQPTLMYAGRLKPSKRPDDALTAWRLVRREMPEARLWIVGDGPMRGELEAGADEGVHVFGRVDEETKEALMSQAWLLLVPSVREGWGIVVMEAAAARTPSIGYRVPGLRDSIRNEETGWLCDPDPRSMARAALDALRHPRRHEIARDASAWSATFSWDYAAHAILDALPVSVESAA